MARRVVLEPGGPAPHHSGTQGCRRRGHHGIGRSGVRRGGSLMEWVTPLIVPFIVMNAILGIVTYVTLLERKFAARMQSRIGPYRVGPHGLLQPIADAIKLMMKEDVVPTAADRPVYKIGRASCRER